MIATHVQGTPMGYLMELMQLAGAPETLEAVCLLSDGCYMAKTEGDIGYNWFLGEPHSVSHETAREAQDFWNGLSAADQDAVLRLAAHPTDGEPIPLHRFVSFDTGGA